MRIRMKMKWPVSMNAMYRNFRGRSILSKRARDYYNWAEEKYPAHVINPKIRWPTQSLRVTILLHPPKAYTYDIDNYFKQIADCLKKGRWYTDDSQIYELKGIKRNKDPNKEGFVNVLIETI